MSGPDVSASFSSHEARTASTSIETCGTHTETSSSWSTITHSTVARGKCAGWFSSITRKWVRTVKHSIAIRLPPTSRRPGWNDGHTEAWAFDEIERTIAIGLSAAPVMLHRPNDRIGLAIVDNGAAAVHRQYFASGGYGFMLGDGRLRYGAEHLADGYYSWQVASLVAFTVEAQRFVNLAFNRDRGPVAVYGARVHVQY